MSIHSYISGNFMDEFNRAEEIAKAEFEEINLYEFIEEVIDRGSKASTSNANRVLKEKVTELKEQFYQAEFSGEYNKWILKIGKGHRNDTCIYQRARKHIEHISIETEGRKKKGIDFISNCILKEVGNYQDILTYLDRFEVEVNESMVTECLFKHFKSLEKEQNGLKPEVDSGSKQINEVLTLRQIALLYYFKEEKMTVGNQDVCAAKYGQENKSQKLYANHYQRITEDDKEIYQHKDARKNLKVIRPFFEGNQEVLVKIDKYVEKSRW